MPQPKDFKFALVYQGVEHELKNSPEGWFDYGTQWKRDGKYFGFERSFTLPLRFVLEGATILRKAFDEKGIQAEVSLRVYRLERETWKYSVDYEGDIDFGAMVENELYVEVDIWSNDFKQKLNAYEKVDYDIPIGTDYRIDVPRGVILTEDATDIITAMPSTGQSYKHVIPVNVVSTEQKTPSFKFYDMPWSHDIDGITEGHFVKTDNVPLRMRITTKLSQDTDNPITFGVYNSSGGGIGTGLYTFILLRQGDPDSNALVRVTKQIENGGISSLTVDESFVVTEPGKYIIQASVFGQYTDLIRYDSGSLYFSFEGSTKTFSFYAIPLLTLYQRLAERMGITNPITGELLTAGEGKNIFVTSGDAVRSIDNAVIRTKFSDCFTATNAILNACVSYEEGIVKIERKDYTYNPNKQIMDVGEVKDLSFSVPTDKMVSGLAVGYEDQTYDEMNGRDEFNTEAQFTMPTTRADEVLDLKSPFRADSYGIQFTKLNLEGKKTTDSGSDNKTFFVAVKQTEPGYEVDRSVEVIDGSINKEGLFNLFLSPKRCLLRHADYLLALLDKQTEAIEFASIAKQESDITSKAPDEPAPIVERADVSIAELKNLSNPLFAPILAKFTTSVPFNLPTLINDGINGYIAFRSNGLLMKGFIVSITEKPARRKEQEWELLLHPDTPADLLVKVRDKTGKLVR